MNACASQSIMLNKQFCFLGMIAATRAQCQSTNKNHKYQHNPRQLVLSFYNFNYSRISPSSNSSSAEKTPCTSEKFLSSAITSSVNTPSKSRKSSGLFSAIRSEYASIEP
ncbi:hypothetical protein ACB094_11G192800 [Castanea mollissima]